MTVEEDMNFTVYGNVCVSWVDKSTILFSTLDTELEYYISVQAWEKMKNETNK